MSERRALLDCEMYKISEEDSQDEEVLSSLSSKVTVSLTVTHEEKKNNFPVKVKPIPPVKPAFLRKTSDNNRNNNNTVVQISASSSKEKITDKSDGKHSSIFQRLGTSSTQKEQSRQSIPSEHVKWPSTSSSSGSENSGEVSSDDDYTTRFPVSVLKSSGGVNRENPHPSLRHQSYIKMKKSKKRSSKNRGGGSTPTPMGGSSASLDNNVPVGVRGGPLSNNGQHMETDEYSGSSTETDSQSCSSCDNQERGQQNISGHNQHSDDHDTGSYSTQYSSTDHPDSESDFGGEDEGSDYSYNEESMALVTEHDIKSWTTGDGRVIFFEYVSAVNSSEVSESATDSTGVTSRNNSKSSISSSSSGIHTMSDVKEETGRSSSPNKSHKGRKGKISRLLTRSTGSKIKDAKENLQDLPQESSSSSRTKSADHGVSTLNGEGSESKEEGKVKAKGPGTREKVFRFKDEHEGEIRQVELVVTSFSKHNLGRRATMVESLLGVVPSRFSSPSTSSVGNSQQQNLRGALKTDFEDKRIMVAGFIPDGPAARNKQIKIGDWLQRVNGNLVDFSNVNSILLQVINNVPENIQEIPLKICLELQRVSGYTITEIPIKNVSDSDGSHFREKTHFGPSHSDQEIPYEIMSNIAMIYISVVNTAVPVVVPKLNEKTKDVIFAWPKESESRKVKALSASHGMFSTLYRLLKDVTGSNPISSRVLIDDEEMDVVFSSDDDGNGLLLLATAAVLSNFNISQSNASLICASGESPRKEKKLRWKDPVSGGLVLTYRIMTRIESLLKYQFGSLSRAFRDTPSERLEYFLNKVLAGVADISEDFLFQEVSDCFLRIPNRIRNVLDERLFTFETSDSFSLCYGRRPELGDQPLFNCLGSCLFYKGMVVTTHLERELATHFNGWWRTHLGLWGVKRSTVPHVWEPFKRLVIWQETFQPADNKRLQEGDLEAGQAQSESIPCYSVIVGVGNYMLGMVLESAIPNTSVIKADIGWIRRGFHCVTKILNSEVHVSLEKWIFNQESEFVELYPPSGAIQKPILPGTKTSAASIQSTTLVSPGPSGILKNTDSSIITPTPSVGTSDSASAVNANSTQSKTTVDGNRNILLPMSGQPSDPAGNTESDRQFNFNDYSYHYGLSDTGNNSSARSERVEMNYGSNDEEDMEENTAGTGTGSDSSSLKWYADEPGRNTETSFDEGIKTVSVTKGNVLFSFIQIEYGRSILLSPKETLEGPYSVLVHNFRQSATVSHHILHKAANARMRLSHQMNDRKWVSKALTPISEHGILFNCDVVDPRDVHKKKPRLRQVSYWVIGRIYPNQREVYLCYQDSSVAQNLLEVAFKLAYYSI